MTVTSILDHQRRPPADPWLIELTYQHEQRWWFTSNDGPESWTVSADVAADTTGVGDSASTDPAGHVGDLELVRIDLDRTRDPFGLLDGEDADLGRIAEVLFDPATSRLDPILDSPLEPLGSHLLILKLVRLTPAWRRFGLGVLLAGTAIKKLAGGVRVVVCDPAPLPDADSKEELEGNPTSRRRWPPRSARALGSARLRGLPRRRPRPGPQPDHAG
jgi:hypothetical protein